MTKANTRVDSQKKAIEMMIRLYCRKNHHTKLELCDECKNLFDYANIRLENCRYGEGKPNCADCKTHCYKKDMKEKMIKIMKFSGPRIIIYNPKIAFKHLMDKFRYR